MKASERIIVIGRQFGSGGRELGKLLSNELSLPYYDKELIAAAAGQCGYRKDIFYDYDERKPSFLRSIISLTSGHPAQNFSTGGFSAENIYIRQSEAIREIIEQGPCVIVGRTADYIARDKQNLFSIFLHARPEIRAHKISCNSDNLGVEEAQDIILRQDRLRERYYNYYTGRSWGLATNYHMSIDTSDTSIEVIASTIISHLNAIHERNYKKATML